MTKINFEKALGAYRLLHTPADLSWKKSTLYSFAELSLIDNDKDAIEHWNERFEKPFTLCNSIKTNDCQNITAVDIFNSITNPERLSIPKSKRAVLFSSNDCTRPVGVQAFPKWSGFQLIDMDIKDPKIAVELKNVIFEKLSQFNWFMGVTLSNSMNGLHVFTKILVPPADDKCKLLYYINYRHKYSYVYLVCKAVQEKLGFSTEELIKWMDMSMARPQQGAFLTADPHPLFSTNFFEDFIYVDFDCINEITDKEVDWVTYPDLRKLFSCWDFFDMSWNDEPEEITVEKSEAPSFDRHTTYHYKHNERWRLANTLVKLYGLQIGQAYLRQICSREVKSSEIAGDCRTAHTHAKELDMWAVQRLNRYHGFNIKVNAPAIDTDTYESYVELDNPLIVGANAKKYEFALTKDQYLGHIKDNILEVAGKITLIDAGAGLGKTEMIKSIVRDGKKVIMVMPFTSTIKSKVEDDKDWDYSYGNRKPNLDSKGLALTVDKFARLNPMDIKVAKYDYIFIDESHLLFMSEYRPVMARILEQIANLEIPVIMATGTPVAETIFFPDITYIKVIKEDVRVKDFKVYINNTEQDSLFVMCKAMAADILAGKRILFPTNNGSSFANKVKVMVQYFVDAEINAEKNVNVNYYKKSNYGEEFMDDINIHKTIKNVDILMCSSYLSVGVDILDKYKFVVYFNELWMPQEMEQFANRIRSNDLHIKLYVSAYDGEGNSKNLMSFKRYNPQLNDNELKNCHSILRLCNAMIERNPVEYKYNTLITSIISQNKYIEFDEVNNKYNFNDVAYKVTYFERKYREYVEQLQVIYNAMKSYGYNILPVDASHANYDASTDEMFSAIMSDVKADKELNIDEKTEVTNELLDIITEDRLFVYKDVMAGKYTIKKGNEWSENSDTMVMTVKNAEIFEKVVPLFVSMSRSYSVNTIRKMFVYCQDNKGHYNFAALKRLKNLINIVRNSRLDRLDIPIGNFMNDVFNFIEENNDGCKKEVFESFINEQAIKLANRDSLGILQITKSPITMETIQNHLYKVFDCLVNKKTSKKLYKFTKANVFWQTKEEELENSLYSQHFILEEFFPEFKQVATSSASLVTISKDNQ